MAMILTMKGRKLREISTMFSVNIAPEKKGMPTWLKYTYLGKFKRV